MLADKNKFWPYNVTKSVILSAVILIGLPILFLLLHYWKGWPHESSLTVLLIGILILGILPILLALLDILVQRGGKIEFKNFRIDFSKFTQQAFVGITIPANIGVPGAPVYESNTSEIIGALKEARNSNIVIVDIENGQAWWKTRLFVLLSGAVRIGTPDEIIFVGKMKEQDKTFIGRASAPELFEILLREPEYKKSYLTAEAIAKQCELIEPLTPAVLPPTICPFPFSYTACNKDFIAFDTQTGLQTDFLHEQLLQNELGKNIEAIEQGKKTLNLTYDRLTDLFCKVLKQDKLDESWTKEKQKIIFFENDTSHFILTNNGKYLRMVSRLSILNELLKNMVFDEKNKND